MLPIEGRENSIEHFYFNLADSSMGSRPSSPLGSLFGGVFMALSERGKLLNVQRLARFRKLHPGYWNKYYNPQQSKTRVYNFRFGYLREIALLRDNYKCVGCNMSNETHFKKWGRSITIDHIDGNGRNSKTPNHSLINLQTLCLKCHGLKDGQIRHKPKTK